MERTARWTAVALALVLASAACGAGDGEEGPEDAPLFTLEGPGVRIGAVDDPDYAFGAVAALAPGPDGRLFSLHRNEAFVRRWTSGGRPDGRISREGEGPGELTMPVQLGFFGDSLWVMDLRWYRATFFDPEGTLLGVSSPGFDMGSQEDGPEGSPPRVQRPLRNGLWYGLKPAWSEAIARGTLSRIPHVLMSAEAEVLDTLWVQEYRPTDIMALLREDGPGGTFGPQPFGDGPLHAVDDAGRMVVADRRVWSGEGEAAVTLTWLDASGDTARMARLPYDPSPLSEARADSAGRDRAERLHGFMSRMRPGLALGDVERRVSEALYRPAHLPAVAEMVAAGDGSIWLRRFDPVDGMDRWWVVGDGGRLLREVETPAGLRILHVEGDRVRGVETDGLDVEYIVDYRLAPVSGR